MAHVLTTHKLDLLAVVGIALLTAVLVLLVPAEHLIWAWVALGALTIILLAAHFVDPVSLVLTWLVTVACLSYFFWRQPIPGLPINVTIDRLFILAVAVAAVLRLTTGKLSAKPLPGAVKILLLMLVYFTISLGLSGLRSIADVSPHFRLAGGYYFPAIAMIIVFLAIRDETQIRKILWFFFAFGLYLTITAWAEYLQLWSVVIPKYIATPELGIHWGRARGPFLVSPTLGITLIFCFFANLYLAAKTHAAPRTALYATNLVMLPAIFFTQTRSVWLAMILCSTVWLIGTKRLRSRAAAAGVLIAAGIIIVTIFSSNIASRDRTRGGVTDPYPVYARIGLAKISARIVRERPITGTGFGHFRDYAAKLTADPSGKYVRYGSQLMEHNNFLSILTETGIIGLLLFLAFLLAVFKASVRLYRRLALPDSGWLNRTFVVLYWILFVDILTDGMFRETSVDPFNNGLFFTLTALILAYDYLLAPHQPSLQRSAISTQH